MGYRISGHDLVTGRPCAPYETAADTEEEARAEAARLHIRITAIEPITALAARQRADDVALPDWDWPLLQWRTRRWALVRLGLEHPRWGRVLWATAVASAMLVRSKIVPAMIAVLIGAGLAAAGLRADPEMLFVVMIFATLFLPLMLAKPWIFHRLARTHAPDGFDAERRLRVDKGEIRWFDGRHERTLPAGTVRRVHQLPHSVLVGLRYGGEISIPLEAFANPGWARRFATRLAESAGIEPHLGFRSAWLGQKEELTPLAKAIVATMAGIFVGMVLLIVLMILWR
jgi:hypothetical protein